MWIEAGYGVQPSSSLSAVTRTTPSGNTREQEKSGDTSQWLRRNDLFIPALLSGNNSRGMLHAVK